MKSIARLSRNYLTSGHAFNASEAPLEFQFKVLNGFMAIVVFAATLFALMGWSGINPIGNIQASVDFVYALLTFLLIFYLRGDRERYHAVTHALLLFSLMTCISLLVFVTHDESRIIWYYLLIFVAYLLGGVTVGVVYTFISVAFIIGSSFFINLGFSTVAMFSNIFGLAILSMLTRLYRLKVTEYEETLTTQKKMLETFNTALESEVEKKTLELRELNNSLELKVQEKVGEIKEQEQMLIAQSRLAAMGEMLSMIAHQWRQPLSTMNLMITDATIKSMMNREKVECDAILGKISDTVTYLSNTIDDFQTYFEPQKALATVTIDHVMERVVQFINSRLHIEDITLNFRGDTSTAITTYPSELVQIFMNLLNNAADAIAETQPEEKLIDITFTRSDDMIRINVRDNGGGIHPDALQKVFEPYFSTKSKNGTGLGLYMAKMIIENHMGGTITAGNGEHGACFELVLPQQIRKYASE